MGRIFNNVFFIVLFSMVKCCPPNEDVAPFCHCKDIFGDYMMFCSNIMNPDQLVSPIKAFSTYNIKMFSLAIQNSSLIYIPDGIFKDTQLESIRFVNTAIMSLSDSDVAFRGLENTLREIRATEANYVAQWDWQQLRNLKQFSLIDVHEISLGFIHEPFPHLSELTAIGIIRAEISSIVDSAFASLPKLTILNMKQNHITELKRNMFPDPAEKLSILDFSDNEMSHLPEDFFTNMPVLQNLHLDRNKLVTLNEKPFLTAIGRVYILTMKGNEFRCDCRMHWIVDAPIRGLFEASCSSPEALVGKQLKNLVSKDLWCY